MLLERSSIVIYNSRVVLTTKCPYYECKMFIRLATGLVAKGERLSREVISLNPSGRIVFIKNKFGLIGFIAISAIISVPITSLLAAKFFKHNKFTPLWLICGFMVWSLILSSAAYYIKWF